MRWQLKRLLSDLAHLAPGGDRAYWWLTAQLLGTQAGMADKWLRVFPTHVRTLTELVGEGNLRKQRWWCFDSGATMAAGLAIALVSDEPGLLTDREDRLMDRYAKAVDAALAARGPALGELAGSPEGRVEQLRELCGRRSARAALAEAGIEYAPAHAAAERGEWCGTISCVVSAGTLEHYTPGELETEVARMRRAVRPGGVVSHVVDHRDHRWHADKRLSPLAHYALPANYYDSRRRRAEYHNRWLRHRYVELLERHGFDVEFHTIIAATDELPGFDLSALLPEYRDAPPGDLESLVTRLVGVRRP